MRGCIGALLLVLIFQGSANADALPSLPPDEAVVLKRCPAALAALEAENTDVSKAIDQAKAAKSKANGLAITCRAAMDLAVNAEKVVDALKKCRMQGDIDAQPLILRVEKAAAESRIAVEDLNSMQTVCPRQP